MRQISDNLRTYWPLKRNSAPWSCWLVKIPKAILRKQLFILLLQTVQQNMFFRSPNTSNCGSNNCVRYDPSKDLTQVSIRPGLWQLYYLPRMLEQQNFGPVILWMVWSNTREWPGTDRKKAVPTSDRYLHYSCIWLEKIMTSNCPS
jgi:hypothetical protein